MVPLPAPTVVPLPAPTAEFCALGFVNGSIYFLVNIKHFGVFDVFCIMNRYLNIVFEFCVFNSISEPGLKVFVVMF